MTVEHRESFVQIEPLRLYMLLCRNWNTSLTQNQVQKCMWVQIPPIAPKAQYSVCVADGVYRPEHYNILFRALKQCLDH